MLHGIQALDAQEFRLGARIVMLKDLLSDSRKWEIRNIRERLNSLPISVL
jgi:hypothetical protein